MLAPTTDQMHSRMKPFIDFTVYFIFGSTGIWSTQTSDGLPAIGIMHIICIFCDLQKKTIAFSVQCS